MRRSAFAITDPGTPFIDLAGDLDDGDVSEIAIDGSAALNQAAAEVLNDRETARNGRQVVPTEDAGPSRT